MTRRLKSRNRKYAGNRTYGGGNTKNRRGKGSKGGRGRAGFHKHKWLRTAKYELEELRRKHHGFHSLHARTRVVTLEHVNRLIENGKAQKAGDVYTLSFPNCKVIGSTPLVAKAAVTAASFSKGAAQSITRAGGTATSATST